MKNIQLATLLLFAASCASPGEVAKKKPLKTYSSNLPAEEVKICIENEWIEEWATKSLKTPRGFSVYVHNAHGSPLFMATIEPSENGSIVAYRNGVSLNDPDKAFELIEKCIAKRP